MTLPRLLPALLLLALLAGCASAAEPDPGTVERLHAAGAPLVAAHAQLEAYESAVAQGGDFAGALALWPEVEAAVSQTVEGFDPAAVGGLGSAERSTLVGYLGGLRTGLDLWGQVDTAMRAQDAPASGGPAPAVDEAVDAARRHMRFLDDLRSRGFPARDQ